MFHLHDTTAARVSFKVVSIGFAHVQCIMHGAHAHQPIAPSRKQGQFVCKSSNIQARDMSKSQTTISYRQNNYFQEQQATLSLFPFISSRPLVVLLWCSDVVILGSVMTTGPIIAD